MEVYQETIKLIDKHREKIKMKFNNEINKVAMENAVSKVIKQREEQLKKLQEEKKTIEENSILRAAQNRILLLTGWTLN